MLLVEFGAVWHMIKGAQDCVQETRTSTFVSLLLPVSRVGQDITLIIDEVRPIRILFG